MCTLCFSSRACPHLSASSTYLTCFPFFTCPHTQVAFQYKGAPKPTLTDVSIYITHLTCFLFPHLPTHIQVAFQYPGAPKPTLTDVSIYITLSSRVAVLGANGAGKSTMIRMLTGGWWCASLACLLAVYLFLSRLCT